MKGNIKIAVLLIAVSALAGCDVSKKSTSGNSIVGEAQPRAITLYGSYGGRAECVQNELARVPDYSQAKYIRSSKTFNTTLGSYETCLDVSVEDHVADTTSRYEYSDDYARQVKHTYSYGGVYVGVEETVLRPYGKGPSVTNAYAVQNGMQQAQWTLTRTLAEDGQVEQFEYLSYGHDGRPLNRISSGKVNSRENFQGETERTLPFTVERGSWMQDAPYFTVDEFLLLPELLRAGRYTLRSWYDDYDGLLAAVLEGERGIELCYQKSGRQVSVYGPNRWGTCEEVEYEEPIAVVDY